MQAGGDAMTEFRFRIDALRLQAEAALSRGERGSMNEAVATDVGELLHELMVYHAELEIQNQELIAARSAEEIVLRRYQLLFSVLPVPAFVVDERGVIDETNEAAAALFGFRNTPALRKHSLLRLVLKDGGAALLGRLRSTRSDDSRGPLMLVLRDLNGSELQMEVHLCVLPAGYHLDARFIVLCLDRSAEVALSRTRSLFTTLLDNSDAMIFAFDPQGRCLLANKAMQKLIGRGESDLIGQSRRQWIPEQDAEQHEQNDKLVMTTLKPMLYEEKLHRPGLEVRYFLSSKFPLLSAEGEVQGVGGITTDITESRQKDIRLELAAQIYRAGTEGIMIADADQRIISVNGAFSQITGFEEHEVLGKRPSILASGRHAKAFYEDMWRSINETGSWAGEIWNRRKSGDVYPEWLAISRVSTSVGETTHYIGVFSDITHRKLAEEEIERLAFYDPLTGTPNRYLLHDRAAQAVRAAERNGSAFAVCFVDLDRFKIINDVFGHTVGDDVLKEVARRIKALVRDNDTVCRLGGDEFVILLEGIGEPQLGHRVNAMVDSVCEPICVNDTEVSVSASIGVAMYPHDSVRFDELLQQADMAMYQAKSAGRNGWRYFNEDMARVTSERLAIEVGLKRALANGEMSLRFQPQVELTTAQISGVEALLRWQHDREFIPPDIFIPIAEESGLISDIGRWVLDSAVRQRKAWLDQGFDHFVMAVNVSFVQFWRESFVDEVRDSLERHGLPGRLLEIELTERIAMKEPELAVRQMRMLKGLGVRLSIDDFGTGYSSLAYLSMMPIDALKIDRAFIRDIGLDRHDEAICRTIIQLAQTLGIGTIAEGLETALHLAFLKENGCTTGQGYLFAHPLLEGDLVTQLMQLGSCRPVETTGGVH